MTRTGKKIGLLLSAISIPAMLALPVASAQAGGYHHRDRYYYGGHGHNHHKHHDNDDEWVAGLLGAGIGLVIGSAIASSQHRSESVVVRERVVTTSPTWRNPDYYERDYGYGNYNAGNGWYGPAPVARTRPVAAQSDGSCLQTREYQTRIVVGGEEVDAYGTACLQPDGAWKFGAPTPEPY